MDPSVSKGPQGKLRRWSLSKFSSTAMRLSRKLYKPTSSPRIYRLSHSTVLKYSEGPHIEVSAIQYVRKHTSIPVPEILDSWPDEDGEDVILMKWIPGRTLEDAWSNLRDSEKARIASQLEDYVEQLRSIPRPPGMDSECIASPDGKAFHDFLISDGALRGPFSSEHELNEFLVSRFQYPLDIGAGPDPTDVARVTRALGARPKRGVLFTHGDLVPRNILIDKNANIVGVLDWEQAGWRPAHWEYAKSRFASSSVDGWEEFQNMFVDNYEEDYLIHREMMRIHAAPF